MCSGAKDPSCLEKRSGYSCGKSMSGERLDPPNPLEKVPAAALLAQPQLLVFHINDNTDDQVLFQAACKKANVPIHWHVAETAERGISYLESLVALSKTQSVR